MTLSTYLLREFRKIMSRITSSKILTRLFFKIIVSPYKHPNCQNWDFTTIIFKKILRDYIKNGQNILEVGTGHLGLLSIYIAKKKRVNITAVDINPIFVKNAKKNAKINNTSISFIQSNLFSNVKGLFDIIFFNPPYLSKKWVLKNCKELYTDTIFDLVWNGGIDGTDIIRLFLNQASNFINDDAKILLGVNIKFIELTKIRKIIIDNNLKLISILSYFWTPSKVFIIKK